MATSFRGNANLFINVMRPGGNTDLSQALDAAGDFYAYGFIVNESITLEAVAIRVLTKTGTPPNYNFEIQTDNGSGQPSGTILAANNSGTFTEATDITANAWTSEVSLTTAATIVSGILYWLVIEPASAPDGSNFIAVHENSKYGQVSSADHFGFFTNNGMTHFAMESTDSGSTWSTANMGLFILKSDDGTPKFFGAIFDDATLDTITNLNWKGVLFTAPYDMNVWGFAFSTENDPGAGAVKGFLIDSSDTILASGDNSAGLYDRVTARALARSIFFNEEQSISQGSQFRIVLKDPNGVQRIDVVAVDTVYEALIPWNGDAIYTEGTSSDGDASPTVWVDTSEELPAMVAIYASAVTNSAGAGGGMRLVGDGGLAG